jgi:hypothetical protein
MTAAVITATMVQKEEIATGIISGGTERRLVRLYLEGPKAAQNDWFLLSTYLGTTDAANFVHARATTMASGDSTAADDVTYDRDDYKLDLTSSDTGTSFAEVLYYTE